MLSWFFQWESQPEIRCIYESYVQCNYVGGKFQTCFETDGLKMETT